jgi:tRNA(Ile2) C34 agmatinyltransferase TiaS
LGGSVEDLGRRLPRIPAAMSYEAYKAIVHHNEISWLAQASLLSRGIEIEEATMEMHLREIPVRAYGPLCPFCGSSVVVEGSKCRFCSREVPETMAVDDFVTIHLKRQFTDKLISLRMLSREGEISPAQYRSTRERYLALRESLGRVQWSE